MDETPVKRRTANRAVWALCAALAIGTAALLYALHPIAAPAGRVHLPWWVLVAAFAGAELGVVHIHARRSSHSLTLAEIPLVLGLLFASPAATLSAWIVGAGAVIVLQRELPPLRVAFNVGLFGVTGGVAGLLQHLLANPGGTLDLGEWAAVTAAIALSALLSTGLVAVAMSLIGDMPGRARLRSMLTIGLATAVVNTTLGLAVAVVLAADPLATALLLVPAAALCLAYRAHSAERNRGTRLEFLYDASRALSSAPDATAGLAGMLALARQTFRAELAVVWTFASPGSPGSRVAVDADGHVEIGDEIDPALADALRALLDGGPARRLEVAQADGALEEALRACETRDVMLAALPGDRGSMGAMMIGDRLGVGGAFQLEELRLFETLAHHTGAALGQDRLGRKVAQLHDIQRHLEHQAFHDPLTGLANRLLFMDRVGHALARRTGNAAVLYIDLDNFKPINDTLGHEAGDTLLSEVAERMRRCLRPSDTAARLGGDEFAVLLSDIRDEDAETVANRLLKAISTPYELAGEPARISASIGLALAASGSLSAEELIRNADAAMYVCKHAGKQGVTVHGHARPVGPVTTSS